MKKFLHGLWISISCVAVMLLTAGCIIAFYITIVFRKLFIKDFTPNAQRGAEDEEEIKEIESATSHLNAIKATLDKT